MVKLNELFLGSHFLTLKAFKSLGAEQVNLALICAPPMSRRLGWIVRSVEFFPFFSSTLAAEKCRGFSPLKTVRLSEKEDRRPLSRTFFSQALAGISRSNSGPQSLPRRKTFHLQRLSTIDSRIGKLMQIGQ